MRLSLPTTSTIHSTAPRTESRMPCATGPPRWKISGLSWQYRSDASRMAGAERVRSEGFEPPTLGSEDRCSIQLSYERTSTYKDSFTKVQFVNRENEIPRHRKTSLAIQTIMATDTTPKISIGSSCLYGRACMVTVMIQGKRIRETCETREEAQIRTEQIRLMVKNEGAAAFTLPADSRAGPPNASRNYSRTTSRYSRQ